MNSMGNTLPFTIKSTEVSERMGDVYSLPMYIRLVLCWPRLAYCKIYVGVFNEECLILFTIKEFA